MVDVPPTIDKTCIRNLTRAYKSLLRKWFRRKKHPSPSHTPLSVVDSKHTLKRHIPSPQDVVDEGSPEGTSTRVGIRSFRSCDSDLFRRNHEASSPRGLYSHKSVDKCFPFVSSLSRNVSGKSRTATTSPETVRKSQSRERESYDSVHHNPCTPRSAGDSKNVSSRRIMYSNSSGMLKPPPIEQELECTLEELCFGCKKKIKVTRQVPTDSGEFVDEEEVLTINVKPGWKKGTKIKFEGKANDTLGAYGEDVIYSISQRRHQLFRRKGDDLELTLEIPLLKALTGSTISVPLLGGQRMDLRMDDEIVYPGYEKIITGQGMPISQEPEKRGNLRITFLVEFPSQLTHDQRSQVVNILQDSGC